jgi:site-specific recombinase XerD
MGAQLETQVAYLQYVNSLRSRVTKVKYTEALTDFLRYFGVSADDVIDIPVKQLQAKLIQYTIDMKDNRKLSPNTMKGRIAAIQTFFQMNDIEGINWKKVPR